MKSFNLANRCAKEILRDPINLIFGIGFPVILLLLLSVIQSNVPIPLFEIEHLAPGVTVFGLAFISLFSATLIAKDRESSLLQRLYTTPLKPIDFILGYILPLIPMAISQGVVCYAVAIILGLNISINILYSILMLAPISIFYISLGLLCGSMLNTKQVGGICGALLTNVSAWLSGVWFELELMGKTFSNIARLLPFYHAVELERAVTKGNFATALPHLYFVFIYAAIALIAAILIFLRQMKKQ